MNKSITILKHLKTQLRDLSRSERKVADWILSHAEQTPTLNIAELSLFAQVSEPTIIRFCRSIGCLGFQDFKLKLAQDLAVKQDQSVILSPEDSMGKIKSKLLEVHRSTLSAVFEEINEAQLDLAVNALDLANQIIVCGYGSSSGIAQDTAYRLFQITQRVHLHYDTHLMGLACSHLKRGDVLLALCQTGNSRELFDHCLSAKRQEATLISICPFSTPIANIADVPLSTVTQPDQSLMGTIVERTKHWIVLDMIIAGLSLRKLAHQGKNKAPPLKQILRTHFIEQPDLVEQAKW